MHNSVECSATNAELQMFAIVNPQSENLLQS